MADLQQELTLSLDREAEILQDLHHVLGEYGPGTEAWKALLKELREQERRTASLGRQLDAQLEQRLETDPSMARLTARGDALINRLLAFTDTR